jgi:hypothetical protein
LLTEMTQARVQTGTARAASLALTLLASDVVEATAEGRGNDPRSRPGVDIEGQAEARMIGR